MGDRLYFRGYKRMKIKWLIIMIVVFFAVGITCSTIIINNKNTEEVDLIAINDLVKTVEKIGDKFRKKLFTAVAYSSHIQL